MADKIRVGIVGATVTQGAAAGGKMLTFPP